MVMHDVKPSHSDLAALESAFAADPSSRAFQPLAEAYLSLGRFMEAMVVCKKGVKAHPSDPSARVLMGRIYADQGKDRKAAEELRAALEIDPDDFEANRILGCMLLGQGDGEEGTKLLERAAAKAPENKKVKEACQKWGVKIPEPEPPPPPPAPEPVPQPPQQPPAGAATGAPGAQAPAPSPVAAAMTGLAAASSAAAPSTAPAPAVPSAPQVDSAGAAPFVPPAPAIDYDPSLDLIDDPSERSRLPMLISMAALAVGALIMLGWWGINARSADRVRNADERLAAAQNLLGVGSYTNYLEVARLAEEALGYQKRGELAATAHAYLAYVHTLRWGEHLEGETYREQAVRHLQASSEFGANLTVRAAAQAYFDFFSGDIQNSIDSLRAIVDAEGTTAAVLASALGHMYLWTGEFAEAQRYLGRAQQQAPRDARTYVALGELARRQDNPRRAAYYYGHALTFDDTHVDALLGNALIILDSPLLEDSRAEPIIEKILEVPDDQLSPKQLAMARFARAQLLFAQDKSSEASEEQEQALMVQPRNPDIHVMIGRRQFREGRYNLAAESIRRAIEYEPNRAGFHIDLARVLIGTPGRAGAREAVAAVERALQAFPDNPSLLVLLGEAYEAAGDNDSALESYTKANDLREAGFPEALFAKGSLYRRQRDYAAASEALEQAGEIFLARNNSRGRAQVLVEQARILMAQNSLGEAENILFQAVEIDAAYPDSYYFLGRVLSADRRRRGAAKEVLELYLQADPEGEYVEATQNLIRRL